jgi:hypothetical protein
MIIAQWNVIMLYKKLTHTWNKKLLRAWDFVEITEELQVTALVTKILSNYIGVKPMAHNVEWIFLKRWMWFLY